MNNYKRGDFIPSINNGVEIQSLLETDMYKFTMLDFILAHPEYRGIVVKWKMTIRSKDVQTAEVIDKDRLIHQLESTQRLVQWITEEEVKFLKTIKTPKWKRILRDETIEFLQNFKLPDYKVGKDNNGNYEIEFVGAWEQSMMWEIFGLKIINALYISEYIRKTDITNEEFSKIIQEIFDRLQEDIEVFKNNPDVQFNEFGTRRAASSVIQRKVNEVLSNQLPNQYMGTSNVAISREQDIIPKGTNAHELRMIPTALYDKPEDIIAEMYEVDRKWAKHFPELAILLPDTYGTSFYLKNCPEDIRKSHIGTRLDSKDPMEAIPEYIEWLEQHNEDPKTKIAIPSDGLNAKVAVRIVNTFKWRLRKILPGIGTSLTNNTKGTFPEEKETMWPFGSFSVVIKANEVQRPDGTWVSCVKLSDNPNKAVGSKERVELFKKTFWADGMQEQTVIV